MTIVSDRTARAYIRSGTTQAVALNISKVLDRVWQAGLLHKLKSQNFRLAFGLISSLFIIEGLSGSGWEVFAIISSSCWSSSRHHSCSYTFPYKH